MFNEKTSFFVICFHGFLLQGTFGRPKKTHFIVMVALFLIFSVSSCLLLERPISSFRAFLLIYRAIKLYRGCKLTDFPTLCKRMEIYIKKFFFTPFYDGCSSANSPDPEALRLPLGRRRLVRAQSPAGGGGPTQHGG